MLIALLLHTLFIAVNITICKIIKINNLCHFIRMRIMNTSIIFLYKCNATDYCMVGLYTKRLLPQS